MQEKRIEVAYESIGKRDNCALKGVDMRQRPIKLRKQLIDSIRGKYELGYGRKKHELKDKHNSTEFIHSHGTYKAYLQHVRQYADWCKEQDIKDWETAKKHVGEYMRKLSSEGKSASSQSTILCALAKAFGMHTTDFEYELPQRKRSDIVRSRGAAVRDKHFSPNTPENQTLIKFCESTGLRRDEVGHIKGTDLRFKDGKEQLHVVSGTKGGKTRYVEIIGNKQHVIDMCRRAGSGKLFPKVHSACDVHSYRGNYACSLYKKYARPLEEIPKGDRYYCRGDMKGKIFDKRAMLIVSKNLGHNRISVIASNYLYNLD